MIFGYDKPLVLSKLEAELGYGVRLLGFEALKAEEFAAYDEFEPRQIIFIDGHEFFLNFDAAEGAPQATPGIFSDGDDRLFGDLGNDWIVGGTGRDHIYGGRGNDLLNADDDLTTNGGLNDLVDGPENSYEDIAYGGAGRDVLIANTGGDRLVDWVGEFNSYIVPFAPFGPGTISRMLQPQLQEYLYDLSRADGADPTRSVDTGNDPARNGEPDGELGMVIQKDDVWHDQTGAPDDPQPGNIPGGERDVLAGANFNFGTADNFAPDSGTWQVSGGRLEIGPEVRGGDAVSVFYVDQWVPTYFEIKATINAGKPTSGYKSNAYLIFDYQSPTDFKFAGINISNDKLEMGHRDAEGWHVDVQTNAQLRPDRDYQLLLALNGTSATLLVNGTDVFTHVYAPRVDADGFSYGLNAGMVGIGANNSKARIDNVGVQVLPPETTLEVTEDFSDSVDDLFTGLSSGQWQTVDSRYQAMPATGQDVAFSDTGLGIAPPYLIRIQATLSTESTGGLIFDQYSAEEFKFAAISSETGQVIIGHYTSRKGWVIDASTDRSITSGTDYELQVTLKGTTVSVELDGQVVLGYQFNANIVDGDFGLMTRDGASSFARVTVGTDDPAF